MSVTMTLTPTVPELESLPSVEIMGSLYRMTVDQYERLVETGVLDDQPIELINGLLVKKMGKKPPHVLACEALRDELLTLIPPGWRLTIEAPIRIPNYDEPEPDLAVVRGNRDDYQDRHPGPLDVGILIEVAETSLDRDPGEKLLAYSRGGVPVYWIVNLVDRQIEVYTGPAAAGYRNRTVVTATEQLSVIIDEKEAGRVAVSAVLPRVAPSAGSGLEKNS